MPGTKPTGIELLEIIAGCRKLGVNKLRMTDFEVEFFMESDKSGHRPIDKGILNDVRMSQLMIDDPFGFEKEILNAEERASHEN